MDMFKVLAEPTRREIVELLVNKKELTATEIYKQFDSTAPAISQHLKVLLEAKLLTRERQSQKRMYSINPPVHDWIIQIMKLWNEKFERIERVVKNG